MGHGAMAKRTKQVTPMREGFQWRFGETREGLPPIENGWAAVPQFHFYGYQWWYNPNSQRFAVSSAGTEDGWAMLTSKELHTYLSSVIADLPTYEATQRMVADEIANY